MVFFPYVLGPRLWTLESTFSAGAAGRNIYSCLPSLRRGPPHEAELLFQTKVLAYSLAIWKKHASHVRQFVDFCGRRSLSIFECTPSVLNLFLLHVAQEGKSFGTVTSIVDAVSFVYRFYLMTNHALHCSVADTKKFLEKVCVHQQNKKAAFDSADIRKLWDSMFLKYNSLSDIPLPELRSFVLCVFQHSTFCRYSDAKNITLDDIVYDADYFKICIQKSKTDQAGHGDFVFLPKQKLGFADPHMLLCLWIKSLDSPADATCYLFPPLS